MACLVGRIKDFIVENREVKSQPKTNRMGRSKIGLCNLGGILVGLQRFVGGLLTLVTESELGQVTVVITLPVHRSVNELGGKGRNLRARRVMKVRSELTSYGRRPLILLTEQRESNACQELLGCLRKSLPARLRSSDDIP